MRHLTLCLFVLTALAAAALPSVAAAQVGLQTGERIRILTSDGTTLVGEFGAATPQGLIFHEDGRERTLQSADIALLEVSTGRHRRFGRHFLATLAAGSVVGGVLGAVSYEPCNPNVFLGCLMSPMSRGDAFAWGFVGGAVLSLPVGVILGVAIKHDRWSSISLPDAEIAGVSLNPALIGGKPGVAASLSF